jgi:hypothetical protein
MKLILATVVAVLLLVMMPITAVAAAHPCHSGTYWSKAYGKCVAKPYNQVSICRDGTSSVSSWIRGACRGHGGVDHVQYKKNKFR